MCVGGQSLAVARSCWRGRSTHGAPCVSHVLLVVGLRSRSSVISSACLHGWHVCSRVSPPVAVGLESSSRPAAAVRVSAPRGGLARSVLSSSMPNRDGDSRSQRRSRGMLLALAAEAQAGRLRRLGQSGLFGAPRYRRRTPPLARLPHASAVVWLRPLKEPSRCGASFSTRRRTPIGATLGSSAMGRSSNPCSGLAPLMNSSMQMHVSRPRWATLRSTSRISGSRTIAKASRQPQ